MKKYAFSLIELLVSLIIISLLIRAFAPIITKKLKATDITVGSFSSKNEEAKPSVRPVTKEDCDKWNALYIPKEMNGGAKNICVTKYNVGDKDIAIASNVLKLSVNQTCTDSGNCCWQGNTSSECGITGNADADYSGCNRTVCQWNAANLSCKAYTANGNTPEGSWRLPKYIEFGQWAINKDILNNNKGKDGLQFCTTKNSDKGLVRCNYAQRCQGAAQNNYCFPGYLWSADQEIQGAQGIGAHLIMYDDFITSLGHGNTYAFSTRCVIDTITGEPPKEKPDYKEPQNQADCDKFNAIFIDKAYNGQDNKNLCVTKYNIGDIYIDPNVRIIDVNSVCYQDACCWMGKTSGNCGTIGNGDASKAYSGCNRTLCTWSASNISCQNYSIEGTKGLWRLPSLNEINGWANNFASITLNKGTSGLQLCDHWDASHGSVHCYYLADKCKHVDYEGACGPSHLWSGTYNEDDKCHYSRHIHAGVSTTLYCKTAHMDSYGSSARCVLDKIPTN